MRAFTFFAVIFAFFFAVASAREDRAARLQRQLAARQNEPFTGPTTVNTTRTAETFAGTVIETCTIKLTPIVVNGQNMVKEERNCTTQVVKSSSTILAGTSTGVSTSTIQPQSTSISTLVVTATTTGTSAVTTSAAAATSTSAASSSSSSSSSSSVAATTSASSSPQVTSSSAASSTSSSASSVVTSAASSSVTSAAPSSSTSSAASASVTSSAAPAGGPAKEIGTATKSASSTPPASTTPAGASVSTTATAAATSATTSVSAAAAEASASATPFTLPGKKLEVLPIGLGVFAGISVIALIVVGLVTYERTKYRKAFRQRKLSEQGAEMGYSGMAQRV